MTSPWIEGLRSVALNVPDLAKAESFYTQVWHLDVAQRGDGVLYLRGSGSDAYLLALHAGGPVPQIRHVTLRARSEDGLRAVAAHVASAGGTLVKDIGPVQGDPSGGVGWGVGRHGPGNNVFSYFVGPDDFVIEYTADVLQVDDSYRTGGPSDWTWPPGRFDQWGVSKPPSERIKQAQKKIRFIDNFSST
jgi:catechol 2,3-dioxygenase-like lactoylglutathione lyase family enzyme